MRPRPSGGASAHDAIDMILSDTEAVNSDTPTVAPILASADPSSGSDIREVVNGKRSTNNIASNVNQSSGSDIFELVDDTRVRQGFVKPASNADNSTESGILELSNGKRIRVANGSPDNAGEGSTSRLPAHVPAVKRSRHASQDVVVDQPIRRKSTARKSTQHISTAHRLRWEASRASSAAAAEENDSMTHEEAMRQAAAERRRSQSARRASHSPTKFHAEAGPGPSTVSQWKGTLDETTTGPNGQSGDIPVPEAHAAESSPDPIAGPSSTQSSALPLARDGPIPITATAPSSSGRQVRPSPFQVSVTPGSWGHAVPMSIPQRHVPRPKNNTLLAAEPNASSGSSPTERSTPIPAFVHQETTSEATAHDVPKTVVPVRKGPTWKTAASPSPDPVITELPSDPIEVDELEGGQSQSTDVAAVTPAPGPIISRTDIDKATDVSVHVDDVSVSATGHEPPTIEATSPLTSLPSLQLDMVPDSGLSGSTEIPAGPKVNSVEDINTVAEKSTLRVVEPLAASVREPNIDFTDSNIPGLGVFESNDPVVAVIRTPPANLEISGSETAAQPAILAVQPPKTVDNSVIEIDDLSDSLPEVLDHVNLNRSRASSSGDSIEEIPADIAKAHIAFSRPPATTSTIRPNLSLSATTEITPAAEKRVLRKSLNGIARGNVIPEPVVGRPSRLKIEAKERSDSASSSSSGSPSKRQSNRLATKGLVPVYNFTKNTSSYISWRQTVEMDGESDVEALLSPPSQAESSGSSSMTLDGVERTITKIFTIPIVESAPPPERRSMALRKFDTRLIDDWNEKSPRMTHNPALHRLIFESYIDECVQGDEPEIKVYNDVDFESIPPHFEFQYSNEMLYHSSVPEPELGLGCDCEGKCSESSTTCSCLKRQRLYNYTIVEDFAYDEEGHLKQAIPIWECGPNCGCPPDCMNRVIQKGRSKKALVDLFKTVQKGWGVRARAPIEAGTFLGIYSGELITEEESERRGYIYEKIGRTYLFDCDGYHIGHPPEGLEDVDPRLAELARDAALRAKQAAIENDDPGCGYNAYSIDAFSYGVSPIHLPGSSTDLVPLFLFTLQNFTRFFNHSCDPNLQIVQAYVHDFHPERPLLVIFTRRDVLANEELCISYKGVPDEEEVVEDKSKKSGKRRKIKKPKTTAAVHVANKKGAKEDTCHCGARNCDGIMFNLGTVDA